MIDFLKKQGRLRLGSLLLIVSLSLVLGYHQLTKPRILYLGFYAGSSWDVPHANDYLVIDRAIERFEEEHPNVKVVYDSGIAKRDYSSWLADQLVAGRQPDAFILPEGDFNLLASTGALADLNKLLPNDFDPNLFYQSVYQAGQYNGSQFAFPFESNPMMMCINLDILEKEGISLPESGWTLEEFYRICQQVTKDTNGDGVIDQYGYTDYNWQQAIVGFGIDLFDPAGTTAMLDRDEVKKALVLMQELEGLSGHYTVTTQDFDEGKVAFKPMTLAEYRTYQPYPYHVAKYSTFSWSCVPMPVGEEGSHATQLETSLFAVSSRSKQAALAGEFLQLLCTDQDIQQAVLEYSQGASVLPAVLTSKQTELRLKEEGFGSESLTTATLDSMLKQGRPSPTFKTYNLVMEQADYLISRAISQNNLDSLYLIQKELEESLK